MSCATEPCDQVDACCLEGGCVVKDPRWQQPAHRTLTAVVDEGLKEGAPALNGTKPARNDKHPSAKHKDRKELTWAGRK